MNGGRIYVLSIMCCSGDNFSKAILACKVATVYNSEIARQILEEVLLKFNLVNQYGTFITDGGMENKGKQEE